MPHDPLGQAPGMVVSEVLLDQLDELVEGMTTAQLAQLVVAAHAILQDIPQLRTFLKAGASRLLAGEPTPADPQERGIRLPRRLLGDRLPDTDLNTWPGPDGFSSSLYDPDIHGFAWDN